MTAEVGRSGDCDRDYDAWLGRLAAHLARSIVETVFDGSENDEVEGNPEAE